MALIIDGYNFLFADRRDMSYLGDGELEGMRDDFLGRLARLRAIEGTDVTVVFDGGGDVDVFTQEFTWHGVKVIFSDREGTADTEIIKLLENSHAARDAVVITNDNELRRNSKRFGARVNSIDEFKRHMKDLFKSQRQAHREPLEKFEGVPKTEVDYWMKEFGLSEADNDAATEEDAGEEDA